MQVADQPDDCDGKRHHKKEENDLAFAPLFPQGTRAPGLPALAGGASSLRRNRDTESFVGSIIFGAVVRSVFLDQRHFRNKPFEFFEPFAQFRFLACYLFLPASKRRARLG